MAAQPTTASNPNRIMSADEARSKKMKKRIPAKHLPTTIKSNNIYLDPDDDDARMMWIPAHPNDNARTKCIPTYLTKHMSLGPDDVRIPKHMSPVRSDDVRSRWIPTRLPIYLSSDPDNAGTTKWMLAKNSDCYMYQDVEDDDDYDDARKKKNKLRRYSFY